MRKILIVIIAILYTGVPMSAQSGDFFTPKEVKKYRFSHLELQNEKDANEFIQNTSNYNFIEALKVNNSNLLKPILDKLSSCYNLTELNLTSYKGELYENLLDSCKGVEILYLRMDDDQLPQLKNLAKLKNLKVLYLFINGKTESVDFINLLPQLRELHIIGNFLPKDIDEIIEQLKPQNTLNVFGISVDRTTDISYKIRGLKYLYKLNLYDNLSLSVQQNASATDVVPNLNELIEEKLDLRYTMSPDLMGFITISYFSTQDQLSEFERDNFKKIYQAESTFILEDEEEVQMTQKGTFKEFNKNFVANFGNSPEFNYPYPQITPHSETFVINPNKDNILHSKTGFRLTIPQKSFQDADGQEITDNIYIKITQMTNPVEFYFSGLKFGDSRNNYSSNFTFNIQATGEKGPALLKENHQLNAFLPQSTDSAVAYFYDYESLTWQDMDFYNKVFASNFVSTDFFKIENSSNTSNVYLLDTASFESRFNHSDNYFLIDGDIDQQYVFKKQQFYTDLDRPWYKNYNELGKMLGQKIKHGKSYIKIEKVVPKIRNKNKQYFKILDKSESLFPELKYLKNINFNTELDPENKHEFREYYIKQAKYQDIRIDYQRGQDYCTFVLKTTDGYKLLKAYFTDSEIKKTRLKQIRKFEKAYAGYLKTKIKRGLEFNALNITRLQEYKAFNENNHQNLIKSKKYTEIKIHQLGSFSFLYPIQTSFNKYIIVQYTDMNGLPIDVKNLFLIDKRYNCIFNIQLESLNFDQANTEYIFATDYAGNLYYANKSDIDTIRVGNNSLTYLKLKKVNPSITDINSILKLIKY
jgi:hypothetical protein